MADTTNRDQLDKFYDRLQTLPSLIRNLGLSIAEGQRAMDQNYIESLAAFTKIISQINNNVPPDALAVVSRANDAVADAGKLDKAIDAANAVKTAAAKANPTTDEGKSVLAAIVEAVKGVKDTDKAPDAAQAVALAGAVKFADLAKKAGSSQVQYLELFRSIAPSHYQFTETAVEVRADLRVASETELTLGANLGIKAGIFSVAVNFSLLKRSASDYEASADLRCVINAIPADHSMMNDLFARAGTPITAAFKADGSLKAVLEALNEMKQIPAAPIAPPPATSSADPGK